MRLRALFLVIAFLLWMLPVTQVHAEERVSGEINDHIDWTDDNDPYIVTGNLKIEEGAALNIHPGVSVRVKPGVVIEVLGTLRAKGSAEEPIVFTWADEGQRWGSIIVRGGHALIDQVHISHADVGFKMEGYRGQGQVYSAVFRDNRIGIHNDTAGVSAEHPFQLDMLHTLVTNNTTGLLLTGGKSNIMNNNISENVEQGISAFSIVHIAQNTIFANGTDGIETVTRGGFPVLTIEKNTINYNGFGALSLKDGNYTIRDNNIFGNARFDIRWVGTEKLFVTGNYWAVGGREQLHSRLVGENYESALSLIDTGSIRLALAPDAPAPLGAPAAQAAAQAPAPAPAPAPVPVATRVPSITDRVSAKAGALYYSETGHNVEGVFHSYFEQHGGLFRFGFPLTEATYEDGLRVQWFERGRMEYHPDGAGTPYAVQMTLLGDRLTEKLRPFPTAPVPCGSTPNCRYFPETKHIVHGVFLEFFENFGGLEAFGYPISELFRDFNDDGSGRAYTMQWFQRARFEHHPEVGPRVILLGLLGLEELDKRGLIR